MGIVEGSVPVFNVFISIVYLVDIIYAQLFLSNINPFYKFKNLTTEGFNCYKLVRVDIDLSLIAFLINED